MPAQTRRSQTVKVRDVAREAGVAVGTVSRVLNDHPTADYTELKKEFAAAKEFAGGGAMGGSSTAVDKMSSAVELLATTSSQTMEKMTQLTQAIHDNNNDARFPGTT